MNHADKKKHEVGFGMYARVDITKLYEIFFVEFFDILNILHNLRCISSSNVKVIILID